MAPDPDPDPDPSNALPFRVPGSWNVRWLEEQVMTNGLLLVKTVNIPERTTASFWFSFFCGTPYT